MIKLYFSLKILIPVAIFSVLALWITVLTIKAKLDSKFKQNCYECKDYKLFDVDSCGTGCRHKCTLKDRIDSNDMNDNCFYVKCKEFEKK